MNINRNTNTIVKKLRLLVQEPGMFLYRFYAKFRPLPNAVLSKKQDGVVFEYDLNFDPEIKLMFYGLYEIETVKAIEKYLKAGDTFIDVGANIGYLSSVALRRVGPQGAVHSFEPVPEYFARLQCVVRNNSGYHMFVNQCALGQEEWTTQISVSNVRNIGWNTLVPGYMSADMLGKKEIVSVNRLDAYVKKNDVRNIALIKIDTEGFEFPVLVGLSDYFATAGTPLPHIICEIAPAAYPLLGLNLEQLQKYMQNSGFKCVELNDNRRVVDLTKLVSTTNVLFIPQ